MSRRFLRFVFLVLAIGGTLLGCASVREKANDEWRDAMTKERFTPFVPPRASLELGNIITFDEQGREYLVALASTCLPGLTLPAKPTRVFFLDSTSDITSGVGIGAAVSGLLRGKLDLEAAAKSANTTKIVMRLGEPGVTQVESIALRATFAKVDRSSDCYKALANPKNLIVISNLSVSAATFEFKDRGDQSVKLTANILSQAKLAPELQRKFDGQASLTIDQTASIGYRALAARELPGLNADKFEFTELGPAEVERYRAAARK